MAIRDFQAEDGTRSRGYEFEPGRIICPDGSFWSRWKPGAGGMRPETGWRRLRGKLIRGYRAVDVRGKNVFIHTLVLTCFFGEKPPGLEGIHRDDDRENNSVDNLYWGTHSENMKDRESNGRWSVLSIQPPPKLSTDRKADIIRRMILGESPTVIARDHGICRQQTYNVLKGVMYGN